MLKNWVYSREIPTVLYQVNIKKKSAIIDFEQVNTDFAFPLRLIIKTRGENEIRTVVIKGRKEQIYINKKYDIKKIKIETRFSPVFLKEKK